LLLFFPWPLSAKDHHPVLRVRDLHPTQFAVGMREVEFRQATLAARFTRSRDTYRPMDDEDHAEVVKAPNGKYYIVDGHHLVRALSNLRVKEIEVHLRKDWSDLESMEEFWEKMEENEWAYLKDETGRPRSPRSLPSNVRKLKDDPYRSLAWYVKKSGAFEKTEIPFAEFAWAEFFRKHITLEGKSDEEFRKAVKKAIRLARKHRAEDLPGYHRFPKEECRELFERIEEML
jgi:hypothetical protein